jgi:hypothetical protein
MKINVLKINPKNNVLDTLAKYCINAASSEITHKAVLLNQDDLIPWKRGVSFKQVYL